MRRYSEVAVQQLTEKFDTMDTFYFRYFILQFFQLLVTVLTIVGTIKQSQFIDISQNNETMSIKGTL